MIDLDSYLTPACLLALTAVSAHSDARTGLIPNWATLPALALAPIAHAAHDGAGAGIAALGSALLCALAPLVLFARGAIGGGDVKLFAAIGAIGGARLGLDLQLTSYALALAYALAVLARRGALRATCTRALYLAFAPLARSRRAPPFASMTSVRLGVPVFLAAALLIARQAFEAAP